jgi:hypothetical protein
MALIDPKETIGEAVRIDFEESTGKLFLVFEITHPLHKKLIKTNWVEDIEYRVVDKKLILEKGK